MDFKNLIEENKQNVKNVIRKFMGRENEDLEQEVYIRVLTAKKYEEKGSFKSWINLIAANVSRDYLKSAKNRYETYVEDEAIFENIKERKTPENLLLKKERQERIIKAIEELKPKLKEVIMLSEIEGYSYEECSLK
ncbi:TPA: RNA polymerase sigma factor, partial [Candidatus Galligastranaerophilus intestinigallinarum]|nr:RNA polymerase sigma factor [Candidatus Galligastranaerophilus intestinigallinarum]